MALPILAKGITSTLVKKGKSAKKDNKVSSQKLLPSSITSSTKSRAQFSKVEPRKLAPYRKKVETTKFLPPSKVDEKFSINKLDALLTSLVGSTANLQRITKKDLSDERKNNRTKENIKQKSKRQRNEEKTESKKTVAKVSKPMKLTMPSLFMDIFKIGGRLILSLGIMELLKFLDPEKKESIFGFLTEHLDKIILGTLGILGIAFVASFLPVISMVGTILSIVSPIILALGGILLPVLAAGGLALYLKHVGMKTITNLSGGEAFLEEHRIIEEKLRSTGVDTFIEADGTRKGRIKNPDYKPAVGPGGTSSGGPQYLDVMKSGTQEQKDAYTTYENRRAEIEKIKTQRDDELKGVKDEQKRAEIESKYVDILQGTDTNLRGFSKPQTPIVGDTRLGSASGDSGSAMYKGRGKKAALSVGITPFLQSDIDKQGISIISGFGKRFGRDHKGYDLPAAEGTPLHAYLPGVVVRNMPNVSGYGNLIEWKDDVYGQTHMFAHMMEPSELRSGTKFKAGTVLGKVGNTDGGTGISEGPHLHWEIGPQGSEVDPGEWLKSHPINMAPKKPPNKAQEVSSTASYEETGTQVAMIQVPLPVPVPSSGGGGGTSSGGSRGSGGYDIDSIILGQSFSNA
jgi:murein DD-endopeptidase MepM/ murein hydrolase activator NlpD